MLVEPQACLVGAPLSTGVAEVVEPLPGVYRHMLLQTALLWKPFSTSLTFKASAVFLLNVLVQLVLLFEPTLAVVALK